MRFFYLDASAFGKRYCPERGTNLVNQLFTRAEPKQLIAFSVGLAEVVLILVRKRNAGQISTSAFTLAMLQFDREALSAPALVKIPVNYPEVQMAVALIESHSINATDAILLRTALDLAAQFRAIGDDLVLVASDQRLVRAAQAEGLATFDPETQDQAVLDALLVL